MEDVKESWSHNEEVYFIDLVHQYPPLWNTDDKNYSKKTLKKAFYAQIVADLKQKFSHKVLTPGSARRKFCRLRSYFKKELGKMKIYKGHSLSSNTCPKWVHFDKMLFLAKEDERKQFYCNLNNSIVKIKKETTNDNGMQHTTIVPNINCSDVSDGMDSVVSSQLSVQSNEDCESIKQKDLSNLSSVSDLTNTRTPVILNAWSASNSNEGTNSPSVQSNEDSGPPIEQRNLNNSPVVTDSTKTKSPVILNAWSAFNRCEVLHSPSIQSNDQGSVLQRSSSLSPVCDSTKVEIPTVVKPPPSAERPLTFSVALGNLVITSLNQMSVRNANAATKEIFEILMKYGSESNHRR